MTQFDESTSPADKSRAAGIDRRTLVKSAAWSAPVIALAVATPFAAASATNAVITLPVVGGTSLQLGVLKPVIGANVALLAQGPTSIVIKNGNGAISASTIFTVSVAQTGGISVLPLPVWVKSLGAPATSVSGLNSSSASFTVPGGIAANATVTIPITFAYKPGVVTVSVLPSYAVTAAITGGATGVGSITALAALGLGTIQ